MKISLCLLALFFVLAFVASRGEVENKKEFVAKPSLKSNAGVLVTGKEVSPEVQGFESAVEPANADKTINASGRH